MFFFKFADIGEGLHEGKVTKILVKIGDKIKDGDSLFEVETDKVTSEITSPVHGKIVEIKIKEDETVHVGDVTFIIDNDSGLLNSNLVDSKLKKDSSLVSDLTLSVSSKLNDLKTENLNSNFNVNNFNEVYVSPLAKKIALANQIDLTKIKGSGFNNRIMVDDLNQITKATENVILNNLKDNKKLKQFSEKTSKMRQAIATNLKQSWQKVAYVSQVIETDVTALIKLRNGVKDFVLETTKIKLTYLPFIAKATSLALQIFPILTASYDEKTQELVYPNTLNLGIAVDTSYGLVVPNIKNAHTLSVIDLAYEINHLAKLAREKKLNSIDMHNGNFTITNYGSAGAIFGVPVIKFPEIAILGVGTITHRMGVDNKEHYYMYLTIAADHRWVDGALLAYFGLAIKKYLEQPELLGVF